MRQSKIYWFHSREVFGDEWHRCFYCDRTATRRYEGETDKFLCYEHYVMHRDDNPWLNLIGLVNQSLEGVHRD